MTRNRVERRDELMMQLGMLLAPLQRIAENGTIAIGAIPYVEAQYARDYGEFAANVDAFCRIGNHFFQRECNEVRNTLYDLADMVRQFRPGQNQSEIESARSRIAIRRASALAAIRAIPCDDPDTILPAASPFQTFMRLRAHCTGVTSRLEIFDPYLDPSVFHLYAGQVPASATLTIVTDYGNQSSPMTKPAKRAAIVAVSELVARERKDKYRFYVATSIHDRYLRADDTILHLGGSLAHAGRNDPFAISKLDPTAATHGMLDKIIAGADEWYGPNRPIHRTS